MSTEANSGDDEQFENIQDVPVNMELFTALREAGASRLLVDLVKLDPEDYGADRNSAQIEVQKYCYWEDEISADALKSNKNLGGHFFNAVWNGDIEKARARADLDNQKLLREASNGERPGIQRL